ncbi:hypothetical protein N9N67_12415 [Bacteriovoracaceae bacterium]|nr:hypothetical protein [Bacteriovoracaceae bacterium]
MNNFYANKYLFTLRVDLNNRYVIILFMSSTTFISFILIAFLFACAKSETKKKKKSPSKLIQKTNANSNEKGKKVCEQNPQIITEEQRLTSINAKLISLSENKEPYILYSKDYLHKSSQISEKSCLTHLEYNKVKANLYSYIKDVFKQVTAKFKSERKYLEWMSIQDNREKRIHLNHFLHYINRTLERVNKNCETIDLTKVSSVEMGTSYMWDEESKKIEFVGFSLKQDFNLFCFPCQMENNKYESGILQN